MSWTLHAGGLATDTKTARAISRRCRAFLEPGSPVGRPSTNRRRIEQLGGHLGPDPG